MKINVSLEEAQNLILAHCPQITKTHCLLQNSTGRVLAEDILAPERVPIFARSAYDGFAFCAEDALTAATDRPVNLEVIEEVPAGHLPQMRLKSGQAIKIFTGAMIPQGADAIVKFESTELRGDRVALFQPAKPGQNILPAGQEIELNDLIASKGTVVTPYLIGLLASLGIANLPVYKQPVIAVICTGDELLAVSEKVEPGKIRNSNLFMLEGFIRALGARPAVTGIAKDRVEEVALLVGQGLGKADMVITTGGASVGDYDVAQRALLAIGAELLYWKIDLNSGSPSLAGAKNGKLILCLSGNPGAAMTIFQLLGIQYIKKISGRTNYAYPRIQASLQQDFLKNSPRRRLLRGKLFFENGMTRIDISGNQEKGILKSMIGSDVFVDIPAGSGPIISGQIVSAILIDK